MAGACGQVVGLVPIGLVHLFYFEFEFGAALKISAEVILRGLK